MNSFQIIVWLHTSAIIQGYTYQRKEMGRFPYIQFIIILSKKKHSFSMRWLFTKDTMKSYQKYTMKSYQKYHEFILLPWKHTKDLNKTDIRGGIINTLKFWSVRTFQSSNIHNTLNWWVFKRNINKGSSLKLSKSILLEWNHGNKKRKKELSSEMSLMHQPITFEHL